MLKCRYPKDRCTHHESNAKAAFGYAIDYDKSGLFHHGTCFRVAKYVYLFTVGHTGRFTEDMIIVPYHYRVVNIIPSPATRKRRVPPDPGVRRSLR